MKKIKKVGELDEEGLKRLGFVECSTDRIGRKRWRIQPSMYYAHQIQVVLGDYPPTNPNCGIVSIYNPSEEVPSFTKNGKKKMVTFKEREVPIAWYVNTYDRLYAIITSLTQVNL